VRELAGRSRGNAMFLRELVTGALETGALAEAGGLWRLQGPLSPTVRLAELVALRLGDLSQSERSVLELLALGEPLGPAELAQLADPLAVDALEERGLVTSHTEGGRIEIRLAHPVYGDVVRAGISALRERAVSRSLAEVIEHRAARLLSWCEGAVTPVVRTITARSRLTPGELDAAVQAAAGRSNKQIAADSHVSVRTVENHLQRVYEKLGISSRRELADALRDQPASDPPLT
jgi:DNA-binding CsgD family transcriptional regulator